MEEPKKIRPKHPGKTNRRSPALDDSSPWLTPQSWDSTHPGSPPRNVRKIIGAASHPNHSCKFMVVSETGLYRSTTRGPEFMASFIPGQLGPTIRFGTLCSVKNPRNPMVEVSSWTSVLFHVTSTGLCLQKHHHDPTKSIFVDDVDTSYGSFQKWGYPHSWMVLSWKIHL